MADKTQGLNIRLSGRLGKLMASGCSEVGYGLR